MQMTYEAQYEAYLSQAQQALEAACDEVLCPGSRVSEAARYSLLGGGKRVRAVLCIAACDMLGGDTTLAARYAAGLEMLHCYSLIHDDLPCMDDDDMRRGRPSCHRAYGEATALLAGDALLTAAFETLAGAGHGEQAQNSRAVSVLAASAGARGMVRGQELDLYYESSPASEAQLCEVHRNKTGMLIAAAAQLGAIAAGAPQMQQDVLRDFAFSVGLVFQMVDDVLDVVSTTQELGKPVGSDVQLLKTVINTVLCGRFQAERLWGAGGMPSSHSALVCALAVSAAKSEGMASPIFAIALVLAAIVMYDATGVRRETGNQAKVLNLLMDEWVADEDEPLPGVSGKKLKEKVGHTPVEVLSGALLGTVLALAIPM